MNNIRLKADGICKRFGAVTASDNISLDLRAGEIHALIGPNGAGKSTLIKQIAGNLVPERGHVFINDQDITRLDTAKRARLGLARTFQVSQLAMHDTVFENALLGAIGAHSSAWRFFKNVRHNKTLTEIANNALERVGLIEQKNQRTAVLSHGQRRLLEIAVALTLSPTAFIMDEPMAGLGAEGSDRMTQFLDVLRSEAPILLVEHDMDAVFTLADRISVLVYGKIIATGSVSEIRSNPEVQRAYLGDLA